MSVVGDLDVWNQAWNQFCIRLKGEVDWASFVEGIFFFYNILISWENYILPCSTYGSTTQSMSSNDAVVNLHCVNTKWVIWKRCWHVDPVIKPNAFTYSVNAPFNVMFALTFSPLTKKKCPGHLTLTGSMKKSLSPWPEAINSISHSSLCLSFLSFSRQIHLHERPLTLARACR